MTFIQPRTIDPQMLMCTDPYTEIEHAEVDPADVFGADAHAMQNDFLPNFFLWQTLAPELPLRAMVEKQTNLPSPLNVPTYSAEHMYRTPSLSPIWDDGGFESAMEHAINELVTSPSPSPQPSRASSPYPTPERTASAERTLKPESPKPSLIVTLKVNAHTPGALEDPRRPFRCNNLKQRRTLKYTFQELEHACTQRYTRHHDLVRHLEAIAKGRKPCERTGCDKSFARRDAMLRHMRRPHGRSPS